MLTLLSRGEKDLYWRSESKHSQPDGKAYYYSAPDSACGSIRYVLKMLHAICSCLYQLRLKFVRRYVIKARLKCISCICHPLSISKWIITRTVNADGFVHCLFYMKILWGTKQVYLIQKKKKTGKANDNFPEGLLYLFGCPHHHEETVTSYFFKPWMFWGFISWIQPYPNTDDVCSRTCHVPFELTFVDRNWNRNKIKYNIWL